MRNLRTILSYGEGPREIEISGTELIDAIIGADQTPPRSLVLQATTEDGQYVTISIPYSDSGTAAAVIGEY